LREEERKTAAEALVANPPAGAIEALERFLARSLDSEFSEIGVFAQFYWLEKV
jgi:hypothetical protein